jgi:putative ABC transport system substrate-binding protein
MARVGLLTGGGGPSRFGEGSAALEAFESGLRELGHVEGQNLHLERRDAEGRYERLPALAAELVGLRVDVIVASSTPDAAAARDATSALPIVFVGADPVGIGLLTRLDRPEGNVTGFTIGSHSRGRRLGLLRECLPLVRRVGIVANFSYPGAASVVKRIEVAAPALGMLLETLQVREGRDLPDAFGLLTRWHAEAVIVVPHPLFRKEARRLAELALARRLPMLAPYARVAELGGLLAYEPDLQYPFRRAAEYVDRILKGARPADLPVEESTRFRLVVNLRTARALGVRIPSAVLGRADVVIEPGPGDVTEAADGGAVAPVPA